MKKIVPVFFLLTIALITTIVLINKKKEIITLTTFPEAYCFVSEYQETEDFEIGIIVDSKDAYFTNLDNIAACSLSDSKDECELQLHLLSIEKSEEQLEIDKKTFYRYQFHFAIDFFTEDNFVLEMEEAILKLNLVQSEILKLHIGSFSLYKIPNYERDDLTISRLKGVVNTVNGEKTLVALAMEIRNISNDAISIRGLQPLALNTMSEENYLVDNLSFHSGMQLDTLLTNATFVDEEHILGVGECQSFLFPLSYQKPVILNRIGFRIDYLKGSQEKYLYFNEFTFYNTYHYSETALIKLEYYTYENY